MREHPLTGAPIPWGLRAYGCNYTVGSEHLFTFQSGMAGCVDLVSDSGTGNCEGFRSGCPNSLIAANGALNGGAAAADGHNVPAADAWWRSRTTTRTLRRLVYSCLSTQSRKVRIRLKG
jgi:hypothetical protein